MICDRPTANSSSQWRWVVAFCVNNCRTNHHDNDTINCHWSMPTFFYLKATSNNDGCWILTNQFKRFRSKRSSLLINLSFVNETIEKQYNDIIPKENQKEGTCNTDRWPLSKVEKVNTIVSIPKKGMKEVTGCGNSGIGILKLLREQS